MNGQPQLLNGAPPVFVTGLLGNLISTLINIRFPAPNWGVFLPGTTDKAIEVSSVVELDLAGESAVSDYPIETGSFTTYNKVILPNTFQVRMTRDGSETQRAEFLNWLSVNKDATTLFDILCPEVVYPNATLRGYRVSRSSSSGAAMIVADCLFQEVRQVTTLYKSSNISDPKNMPSTPTARVSPVETTAVTVP